MLRLTSNTAQTEVGRCGLSGGNIEIGEGGANFPQGSSPQTTLLVCEEWGVAKRPQKIVYWRHKQEKCQFQPEFQTRLLRTIPDGTDIGYKGMPRNHCPQSRGLRTPLEVKLLSEIILRTRSRASSRYCRQAWKELPPFLNLTNLHDPKEKGNWAA